MTWDVIAKLIIAVGLPVAEKIWAKWNSGAPVTQADFDELRSLAKETGKDHLILRLKANNIPLDSELAKSLISLMS